MNAEEIERLTRFVTERLDADERIARDVLAQLSCGCHSTTDDERGTWEFNGEDSVRHSDRLHEVTTGASWGATYIHDEVGRYIAHNDPARILREVASKRRILAEVVKQIDDMDAQIESEWGSGSSHPTGESDLLLKLLAAPYDQHPDWDEPWRP